MPVSKGRRQRKGNPTPNTDQSPHPSQTATVVESKPCYRIWRLLVASLRASLGWLRAKIPTILKGASVLIGIAAGALFFLPRVTVDPSGPYDPLKPSPITFTISNVNIVPLRNVAIGIGVCYIISPGDNWIELRGEEVGRGRPPIECNGPVGAIFTIPIWHVRWLNSDEKFQIALEDFMKAQPASPKQIEKANMTISIKYEPWRIPLPERWKPQRQFRFVTKKLSNGTIFWVPTPLNQ